MQELKVVKKQLVCDLDKNEAPSGWRFVIDRFIKFGDGSEKVVPDTLPLTPEQAKAHIGDAVLKQAADIENFKKERDAFKAEAEKKLVDQASKAASDIAERDARLAKEIAERDAKISTAAKLNEELTKRLAEAEGKLARIAQADAQYDASVKPLFASPETRQ